MKFPNWIWTVMRIIFCFKSYHFHHYWTIFRTSFHSFYGQLVSEKICSEINWPLFSSSLKSQIWDGFKFATITSLPSLVTATSWGLLTSKSWGPFIYYVSTCRGGKEGMGGKNCHCCLFSVHKIWLHEARGLKSPKLCLSNIWMVPWSAAWFSAKRLITASDRLLVSKS